MLAAAYDLRVFFGVVDKAPGQVRPADVLGFITAQRTGRSDGAGLQPVDDEPGGVATSTVARRLSIISGFFAYLVARGDIDANPVPRGLPTRRERSRPGQGVPLTRRTRRLPRVLTPEEVDQLSGALRTHRDRAMVAAMVFGGLRRCEVLGLDEVLAGARGRAGLAHATCHELRHTCLTRLREAGMALEAVQAQAGHASIESTRIYLHLADDWLAAQYRKAAEVLDAQLYVGQPSTTGRSAR